MESPATGESATIVKLHPPSSSSEISNGLFSMIYPFNLPHQHNHVTGALVSPDNQSNQNVCNLGGGLTLPFLVTKQALNIVSPLGKGDGKSITASKENCPGPVPLIPRAIPVPESIGSPLPEMPLLPSHQRSKITCSTQDASGTHDLSPHNVLIHCDNHPSAPDVGGPVRLNKFVRRLHDMLQVEKDSGIVEWRRGLLVLFSTDAFSKRILPKYFNTRNFKTFRRQLNYYGFVHVRSLSATGNTTTALWINQELAKDDANDDISAVLKLRRVEPCETAKTVEGRRHRKELALHTVEEDIGLTSKTLQLDQIRSMAIRGEDYGIGTPLLFPQNATTVDFHPSTTVLYPSCDDVSGGIPRVVHIPTDSEESNHHSDNFGVDDDSSDSPLHNTYAAAAANMLLMLARS